MSEEQAKVAITKDTIQRYRRYKRLSHPIVWLLRGVICLGMTVWMAILMWNSPGVRIEDFVGRFFIILMVVGVSGFLTYTLISLFIQPHWEDTFNLLERWEKFSGRPIEEFPLSELHVTAYEGWATGVLWQRASEANLAFRQQHEIRKASKEKDYSRGNTADITRTVEYYESAISEADKRAQKYQRSFLDFWDLVTEKDGLKILKGPEWQDPEKFRQKVLVENEGVAVPC